MSGTVHIIGAGLAGLSAAVRLLSRGTQVVVHEATAFAGGRCRSYHDAAVGMTIDNGNHLLLSGNHAALDYVRSIGAEHRLAGPPTAEFAFADLASGKRWTLRFNDGRIPFWVFDSSRRVPGTGALDYVPLARLLWAPAGKAVGEVIRCEGLLYERLVEPLLLAALNIDPPLGAARLASAVIRETLALGGRACRPLIARDGLGATLVEPALALLRQRGAKVLIGASAARHSLCRWSGRGARFRRRNRRTRCGRRRHPRRPALRCAPRWCTASKRRPSSAPSSTRISASIRRRMRRSFSACSTARREWLFAFPGRLSITISAADRLIDAPRETAGGDDLARSRARDRTAGVARRPGRSCANAARPSPRRRRRTPNVRPRRTRWRNLVLAGDWTDTGLPATIEGAIRSGNHAADLIAKRP